MTNKPRYLSKSRFKKALECPTKLYYTGKPEYEDQSSSDSFLEALAEGGYQVGELAKCYYPGGIEIETLNYTEALELTEKYLQQENVILYEPAFLFENLFVRVDILVKQGNKLKLIEVKAKSYIDSSEFTDSKGQVSGKWKAYLMDVAFQKYVVSNTHPEWLVTSYLMLANKNTSCSIEGLNQSFPVKITGHNRLKVEHKPLKDYGNQIITTENVDNEVQQLWDQEYQLSGSIFLFDNYLKALSEAYSNDDFIDDGVGGKCKGCEFQSTSDEYNTKSGFLQCWKTMHGLDLTGETEPLVFDLTGGRTGQYFENGINFLKDLPESEFEEPHGDVLTGKNRRFLHVIKTKEKDETLHFEKERFKELSSTVKYPLNMIDFETTMVAIPFHASMRPYEQIAFQFSHHIIEANGEIRHETEWINTKKGRFPNFEFVRNLKAALDQNGGTIFRYSHHENTVLRQVHAQLYASNEPGKIELMAFIDSITQVKNGLTGERNMVDLCDWVNKTYFDVATNGSSSLKVILPSILNHSKFLQEKYANPIYGSQIKSKSIGEMTLIQTGETGEIINPYKLLPGVFDDFTDEQIDELWSRLDNISEGGTAMTAYAKMQFTEMPEKERIRITQALLRYCELDTMAMVLLWEGLRDFIERS